MPNYWIGIACRDHVKLGENGGFAQLGHGKHSAVKSIKKGDWIAYYCPRSNLKGGDKVQAFCTIGTVTSDEPYQVTMEDGFMPYRIDVDYHLFADEVQIRPLLDKLNLTKTRGTKWGLAFMRSKIKADEHDFALIKEAMMRKVNSI